MLPCYHLAHTFSFERARTRSATTSKGFLICISLSPWPMYYQCKWPVQLALIVFFTSKCLRNKVIGPLTLSAEVISRSKTISGTLKRTITFCPRDFCLRYYLDLSQGFFLYKVRHLWNVLWNVLWLKLVDVSIRHSLIRLMSHSIPLNGFLPITAIQQRPRCVRYNIHGPWIVDDVDFYSSLILNYTDIISALSRFIVFNCLA